MAYEKVLYGVNEVDEPKHSMDISFSGLCADGLILATARDPSGKIVEQGDPLYTGYGNT